MEYPETIELEIQQLIETLDPSIHNNSTTHNNFLITTTPQRAMEIKLNTVTADQVNNSTNRYRKRRRRALINRQTDANKAQEHTVEPAGKAGVRKPMFDKFFGKVDASSEAPTIGHDMNNLINRELASQRKGNPPHAREGMLQSQQAVYLGPSIRAGKPIHRLALFNTDVTIDNPATGEKGVREGHAYVQLYVPDPGDEKEWGMYLPRPMDRKPRAFDAVRDAVDTKASERQSVHLRLHSQLGIPA
ncbi:hypothetical protein R3P38DRAFT_2844990 [Favolaschia claudopus]|uniref:Uncharacterized protein n=1 Tax=Favolaschia claudopus TaxID=2862362 RepID=A0AAW0DQJ2_9AGAR